MTCFTGPHTCGLQHGICVSHDFTKFSSHCTISHRIQCNTIWVTGNAGSVSFILRTSHGVLEMRILGTSEWACGHCGCDNREHCYSAILAQIMEPC